ncbi:MAG: hypothetical protein IJ228_01255 [Succinivibrio sp.]|nr:hypothetical protein [Succinivibrio sp.]
MGWWQRLFGHGRKHNETEVALKEVAELPPKAMLLRTAVVNADYTSVPGDVCVLPLLFYCEELDGKRHSAFKSDPKFQCAPLRKLPEVILSRLIDHVAGLTLPARVEDHLHPFASFSMSSEGAFQSPSLLFLCYVLDLQSMPRYCNLPDDYYMQAAIAAVELGAHRVVLPRIEPLPRDIYLMSGYPHFKNSVSGLMLLSSDLELIGVLDGTLKLDESSLALLDFITSDGGPEFKPEPQDLEEIHSMCRFDHADDALSYLMYELLLQKAVLYQRAADDNKKHDEEEFCGYFNKARPSIYRKNYYQELSEYVKRAKEIDVSFGEYLVRLIHERELNEVEVYQRSHIDRRLFSKLRSQKNRPARRTVLALCFGLKLNYEEAQDFLRQAGYAFTRSISDLIVRFMLERELWDLDMVNEMMLCFEQQRIGSW